MKIALTRPKYDSFLITPPLGLGYISSYLKKNGYETKIIDGLNKNYDNNEICRRVNDCKIVGISCLSDYFLETVRLCKMLISKGHIVIIGGPHATCLPFLTLKETNADFVVVGEGEETMLELIKALEKNKPLEKIPGLVTKKTKKIIERPFIKNLDDLPFPDWEQIDPRKYKKAPHGALIKNFPVAPITTTRGCPCNCKFCASPKLWKRTIRFRSTDNVIEEIKYLTTNFGIKEIHFEDDNLTLKRDHIKKICNLLIKKNIKISWACPNGIRIDTLDESLLKLMKKTGCYYLAFGIESGNQEMLDSINKNITLEQIRKTIMLVESVGIMTQGSFLFGLPGETKNTIKNTINFAKSLPLSRAQFLLLDPIPGSEFGDTLDFEVDWSKLSFREAVWVPPGLNKKFLNATNAKAFRSFYFRPKQMMSLIKYFKISQIPFIIKRILHFHIFGNKKRVNRHA